MHRRRPTHEQGLSPWRAMPAENDDDRDIEGLYRQILPKMADRDLDIIERINQEWNKYRQDVPMPSIRSRRPVSNVQSAQNSLSKRVSSRPAQSRNKDSQRSSQRLSRDDIKKAVRPLQELQPQNFVLEGTIPAGKQPSAGKKREPSYITKQKFAQIRRSMHLQLGIWGNSRPHFDYNTDDKQNLLFRLTKYNPR